MKVSSSKCSRSYSALRKTKWIDKNLPGGSAGQLKEQLGFAKMNYTQRYDNVKINGGKDESNSPVY
jgi:hypothetical protein